MGNDYEIKQLIRHESETILNSALARSKGSSSYDFEKEFAKTRGNKSFVVAAATGITILALVAASFAVTKAIEKSAERTQVDVTAFDDINLKDILDASKRNEADLGKAKLELARMDSDLASDLAAADRNYLSAVEDAKARARSRPEEAKMTAEALTARDATRKRLLASRNSAAAAKKAEIQQIQGRIDQYDSRSLAQAKQQEAILANERLAFDIEKKQQADFYESRIAQLQAAYKRDIEELTRQKAELAASLTARYNPTFVDERSVSLLAIDPDKPSLPAGPLYDYLATAGILDGDASSSLDRSLDDYKYLARKLRSTPYINSVPSALARLEDEAESSIAAYRAALSASGAALESRDKSIATLTVRAEAAEESLRRYRSAMASLARDNRESGYVLDVSKDSVSVYLAPGVSVSEGDKGYVVRGDAAVASVSFYFDEGSVLAKITSTEGDMAPRPFDSILVERPRKSAQ
jgi:hypothetical protein